MQNNLEKLRGGVSFERLSNLTKEIDPEGKGISSQQIHRLEKGKSRYNTDNLDLLSKALGCRPGDIIEDDSNLANSPLSTYSGVDSEGKKMARYIASIAIDSMKLAEELAKEGMLASEDIRRIAIEATNWVVQGNQKKITKGLLTHIIEQEK